MANSRGKTKSASTASPKRLEIPAGVVKEIGLDLAALPYDEQCVVVGAMVMDPLSARTFLDNHRKLKDGNAAFLAWADRMCSQLKFDKQHKPVAAKYVGKAVVERTRQDPSTKDEIKRPDIIQTWKNFQRLFLFSINFNSAMVRFIFNTSVSK